MKGSLRKPPSPSFTTGRLVVLGPIGDLDARSVVDGFQRHLGLGFRRFGVGQQLDEVEEADLHLFKEFFHALAAGSMAT